MYRLSLIMVGFFLTTALTSQQSIFNNQQVTSPEIHNNHSVTFRLYAPLADSVQVTGDFLPTVKMDSQYGPIDVPGKAHLSRGENGVWSFTSSQLDSELYNYTFLVDGQFSVDPSNPFIIRDVAYISNLFIIDGSPGDLYKVNDIPHGSVTKRWYQCDELEMDRRITIYTPPGYESSVDQQYPVLYLLHGAGGDEEAWMTLGRASQILDNLIATGKAEPMIVVMPNGNVIQDAAPGEGSDGFYKPQFMIPGTMNGRFEKSFSSIINFIESNYRVKTGKENRAIAGLSMGGFHALHISRYFPGTFDYVGLFSAAIMPRQDETGEVYTDLNTSLKEQMDEGYELYWIAIGKKDFLYDANTQYKKTLDNLGMDYEYVESEGGHIWRNWRIYLSQFAPRLFK